MSLMKSLWIKSLLFLVIVACVFDGVSFAEELSRGRLADGRAFRTDPQGVQIVDYIAELEVTVEGLNRRIIGLEDELEEKHVAVQRMRGGKSEKSELYERDLKVESQEFARVEKADPGLNNVGSFESIGASVGSNQNGSCPRELEEISNELERTRSSCEAAKQEQTERISWHEKTLSSYKNDLKSYASKSTELSTDVATYEKIIQGHEDRIQALQLALKERDRSMETLQARFDTNQQTFELEKAKALRLEESLENSNNKVAQLARAAEKAESSEVSPAEQILRNQTQPSRARASIAQASTRAQTSRTQSSRTQTMQAVRGKMKTELNQARSLIQKRNALFKKYQKSTRSLSLSPTKAVSRRYLSISQIGRLLDNAVYPSELGTLRRDILDIKRKMSDDVALIKRLERMS